MASSFVSPLISLPLGTYYERPQRISKLLLMQKEILNSKLRNVLNLEVQKIELVARGDAESLKLTSSDRDTFVLIRIELKGTDLSQDFLKVLDQAIPYPIIFELVRRAYQDSEVFERCLVMGYKENSFAEGSVRVSKRPQLYVVGAWFQDGAGNVLDFPLALSVREIYEQLYMSFVATNGAISQQTEQGLDTAAVEDARPQLSARELEEQAARRVQLEKEIERLQKRWKREKQHNRRTELRKQIRWLKSQLSQL